MTPQTETTREKTGETVNLVIVRCKKCKNAAFTELVDGKVPDNVLCEVCKK